MFKALQEVILAVVDCGANMKLSEKSAYNNVQVGGAPAQKFYRQCKLRNYPKHKEILFFRSESFLCMSFAHAFPDTGH